MTCVLAVPGNELHAQQLAERLGVSPCPVELRRFPDGEIYVRVDGDLAGQEVALVGSLLGGGDSFLTIAFLAGTARDLGATSVGLVAPYLAYMRQDAQFHPGEGVTARYVGRLMSQVVDWLVTVDPHLHRLDALERVYSIPTTIARSAPAIASYVRSQVEHPVLVGPDAESVQWVSAVAESCGAPYTVLEKTRRGDRDVSITAPETAWNGHTPVLIDDIVSTGKTMIEATRQLRAAGSAAPLCIAIHAVFADALEAELLSAGARGIVTCDTVPHTTNRICIADSIASAVRARLG
ncbi:MAG: ribose-phosphate pyrophosphokinase [Myxococcales bacterium]|nr:ribose-phosphate pyrophosphokinase [Myxococcales bacterium]